MAYFTVWKNSAITWKNVVWKILLFYRLSILGVSRLSTTDFISMTDIFLAYYQQVGYYLGRLFTSKQLIKEAKKCSFSSIAKLLNDCSLSKDVIFIFDVISILVVVILYHSKLISDFWQTGILMIMSFHTVKNGITILSRINFLYIPLFKRH